MARERSLRRVSACDGVCTGTPRSFTRGTGDVAARTFEDSSGVIWEVFEVHRTSEAPRGVSAGLEKGWLSFVSDTGKRRLAPFPTVWREATDSELERLCAQARVARPPRFNEQPTSAIEGRSFAKPYQGALAAPPLPSTEGPAPDVVEGEEEIRAIVRAFARDARLNKLPAIEAMVRLKGLLHERFGASDAEPALRGVATDVARVRRWFVEAFYFDRPM